MPNTDFISSPDEIRIERLRKAFQQLAALVVLCGIVYLGSDQPAPEVSYSSSQVYRGLLKDSPTILLIFIYSLVLEVRNVQLVMPIICKV